MKLLLDTHVWLWWLTDPTRMAAGARAALDRPENESYLSAASTWELVIKHASGRISLARPPTALLTEAIVASGVRPLPVENSHALHLAQLPSHHRDPFDRMLIAQAQVERMVLVTADPQLRAYDVPIIWD